MQNSKPIVRINIFTYSTEVQKNNNGKHGRGTSTQQKCNIFPVEEPRQQKLWAFPQWNRIILGTLCFVPFLRLCDSKVTWGAPALLCLEDRVEQAPSWCFKEFLCVPQATLAHAEKQFSTEYNSRLQVLEGFFLNSHEQLWALHLSLISPYIQRNNSTYCIGWSPYPTWNSEQIL